jgi:hypothetical protein
MKFAMTMGGRGVKGNKSRGKGERERKADKGRLIKYAETA